MARPAAAKPEPLAPPPFLVGPLAAYRDYLRFEKRSSPHTVAAADNDLNRFAQYCAQARLSALTQLDSHLVRAWIAAEHRSGRDPATLHRYLSSLRSFCRFLLREKQLSANPAATVRAPKHRRRLPEVIDAETLNAALDRVEDEDFAVRDQALVELFYSTGLRLAELQGLDANDFAGSPQTLTVTGKGRKQRLLMIGQHAREALTAWLAQRGQWADAHEPALFVSTRGSRLSRGAIAQRLRVWAQRSGLNQHLHPHRLRHSFATHMLENSGDLRAVQELLGHAQLSTTQIYTQLDWQRLAGVYDQAHPRARRAAANPDPDGSES
ncbi:integrase/recombinase XerC [Solimonas aquatica]|uniref:Tyrosine recombinase XerC n=1 Tax=Solimonas aquatica TaxID=489703 RepID=A0A1H9EJI1_9GAMM|nr:tyrosine recombinase XerC [Solimonas aquatica]SEQ25178.1 integrase/recombinase XerC [Solimonas aquatica]